MTQEDLQLLQRRCRTDPASYAAEYETALRHYEALLASVTLSPSAPAERLEELLSFMAAVCPGYPASVPRVVPPLLALLSDAGPVLSAPLRRAAVRSLALLRAKGVADGGAILPLFFRLLACADKPLRAALHGHIVADIKRSARGGVPARASQAFLFGMLTDPSEVLVKRSLHVLCDLYSRGVWADARTANVVAGALFHPSPTPAVVAARFLLGTWRRVVPGADGGTGGLDEEEAEAAAAAVGADGSGFGGDAEPPLAALYDPQEVAERLFADIRGRRKRESFDTRLLLLNLLTRLVGFHRLLLLGVYPYLQRYLQPHQESVPAVLACLVQGVHERVPPEELHPLIRALADNFVCDRSSVEAIATGLNAIRAVCARAPLAIMDPADGAAEEEAAEEEAAAMAAAAAAAASEADGGAAAGDAAAAPIPSAAAERRRLHAQLEASTGGSGKGKKAAARAARRRRARAVAAGETPSDDDDDAASVATATTAGAGAEATSALLADLIEYRHHRDKGVTAAARGLVVLYRRVHPGLLDRRVRGKEVASALAAGAVLAVPVYGEAPPSRADGLAADGPAAGGLSDGEEDAAVANGSDSSDGGGESASSGASGSDGDGDSDSDDDGDSDSDDDGGDDDDGGRGGSSGASAAMAMSDAGADAATAAADGSDSDSDADADGTGGVAMDEVGAAVSAGDLASARRRQRKTLEEKLEAVRAGRVGRPRHGSSRGAAKGGGSTNADKRKTKAASMVLHKQRAKGRGSFRDKQIGKGRKIGNKQKRVYTKKY